MEYSVAAILYLLFMVHIMLFQMVNLLYFYISTFRSSQYRDSLPAGRSEDRIPVRKGFSILVQVGPGTHPASYTTGSGSLSWG
jgi:hypothetical protein